MTTGQANEPAAARCTEPTVKYEHSPYYEASVVPCGNRLPCAEHPQKPAAAQTVTEQTERCDTCGHERRYHRWPSDKPKPDWMCKCTGFVRQPTIAALQQESESIRRVLGTLIGLYRDLCDEAAFVPPLRSQWTDAWAEAVKVMEGGS